MMKNFIVAPLDVWMVGVSWSAGGPNSIADRNGVRVIGRQWHVLVL